MRAKERQINALNQEHVIDVLLDLIQGKFRDARDNTVKLKKPMLHTRYLFGPLTEIEGTRLRVLERNDQGDCLCLIDDSKGQRLVDVDYRDIEHEPIHPVEAPV